jgi:phosphoglycolate phosphatase
MKKAKKYKHILFDLDGTLTESAEGITRSVAYALEKFGIKETDYEKLKLFVGPPLVDAFMKFYGFSEADAKKATEYYRERFRVKGIFENALYDGITEVLDTLKKAGFNLIIATSKPEEFAKRIVAHFDIEKYFSFIAGATFDGTRGNKSDVIKYALDIAGITDKSSAIMIGDRHHDINGANAVGIDSIGVLYGYGDKNELVSAGATYIAKNVKDIEKIILD